MANKVTRLFEQFKPSEYDLLLDIDKVNMTFTGLVKIKGQKTGRPSSRITLHAKDLKVSDAKITKFDKKDLKIVKVARINYQKSFDEVRLHAEELLYPGKYLVELKFSGKIDVQMHGIYPCFFKHDNKDKTLVTTQFESHSAREAFPCIDEPEAKAVFNLTLVSPSKEIALANTPVKSSKVNKDRLTSVFEPSPVMSTYLLAFAIGEMHCVEAKASDGTIVKSWASVAQPLSHLQYANDECVKILEFFCDYFETPFPLKKIDQVAVPDFDSLAMENWGLITFREVGLLTDPVNRSLSSEQLITLVISHELSHQWFGNLVTMKWWDDLWLNESFASLMENIAPDKLHPDWNQWEDFATGRVLSCSHRDIYKDVQPVGVKVKHPDEILSLFDPAIVYAKGARLLSMLYEFIGEETFRKALKIYFDKNKYSNTTRHDLWKAMSEASGMDIDKLMTPWIEQSGQPLLKVNKQANQLHLSQQRFLLDSVDLDSTWPIPLLASEDLEVKILDNKQLDINYSGKEVPIFNINGSGHYIVKYENDNALNRIKKDFIDLNLSSISRITVLNDMLLLSRSGDYSLVSLLDIIKDSSKEPRDAVWSMLVRTLAQAQTLTDGNEIVDISIRKFKNNLSNYWFNKLGWEDKASDDPNTKHLRTTAVSLSIAGENKASLDKALNMFSKYSSVEKLPAEQRAMIAGVVVRHGNKSSVDKLFSEYSSTHNPDVQQAITVALCSTRDTKLAEKIIKWGLSKDGAVRQQDIDYWFAYMMRNYRTRDLIWQWFVSSWEDLSKLYSGGKHMEYFIWYAAGPLSTPEWQKKFHEFFSSKVNEPSLKRNINISYSEIEARVNWRKREEKALIKFFANL